MIHWWSYTNMWIEFECVLGTSVGSCNFDEPLTISSFLVVKGFVVLIRTVLCFHHLDCLKIFKVPQKSKIKKYSLSIPVTKMSDTNENLKLSFASYFEYDFTSTKTLSLASCTSARIHHIYGNSNLRFFSCFIKNKNFSSRSWALSSWYPTWEKIATMRGPFLLETFLYKRRVCGFCKEWSCQFYTSTIFSHWSSNSLIPYQWCIWP
jgi:hypothetical protein